MCTHGDEHEQRERHIRHESYGRLDTIITIKMSRCNHIKTENKGTRENLWHQEHNL
jgi:hypothetical protein